MSIVEIGYSNLIDQMFSTTEKISDKLTNNVLLNQLIYKLTETKASENDTYAIHATMVISSSSHASTLQHQPIWSTSCWQDPAKQTTKLETKPQWTGRGAECRRGSRRAHLDSLGDAGEGRIEFGMSAGMERVESALEVLHL